MKYSHSDFLVALYVSLALRVIVCLYCFEKSKKLNRKHWLWGLFGFLSPFIAFVWIQFMKPIILREDNPSTKRVIKGQWSGYSKEELNQVFLAGNISYQEFNELVKELE